MAGQETWGTLPKAQDDSTTIDAEISAAIAAHNADPDAHTATGQALDLHRVNEVLDHPAGSVLADKSTSSEVVLNIVFQVLDGIEASANVSVALGLGVTVDVTAGTYTANYFYIPIPTAGSYSFIVSKDFLVQFPMLVSNDDPGPFKIGPAYYAGATEHGVMFVYDGTHLKAVSTLTGATYTSGNLTFDPANLHIYRIQYTAATRLFVWLIDGVQVASWTLPTYTGGIGQSVNFEFDIGSMSEPLFNFPTAYISVQT